MKSSLPPINDSFSRSINKSMMRKKVSLIVLGVVLVGIVVAGIAVGLHIRNTNRIAKAKSVITQLEINSTYKEAEFSDEGDWDNDGIANAKEEKSKTNLQSEDTDCDGITDGDELKLGTDPTNEDTDGDGLLDGYELMAGTNPRMSSTDGKTKDSQRELTVKKKSGKVSLTLTGDANIADTTVEELDLFGINSNASIVSKAYDSYSDYQFASASITFELDKSKISKMGYSNADLTILKFDVVSKTYTKVSSKVSSDGSSISADITELGTYVVGVEKTVNESATTRVCFLIDNSGSMYPKEQCETSSENDVDFKRLTFAQSLIDKFESDYLIGICKFTGSYSKMVDFTSDRQKLTSALNQIQNDEEIFNGTHSQTALENCIDEFTATANGKYRNIIVMLTDGESDESNPASVEELQKLADEKNVIVLTVGLGRDIDRDWLQELAYSTSGKYYSASDANALDDVYKQIVTTLNYDIVSYSDSDDEVSGYALYNTGFDPKTNGFSFKNFRTTTTSSVDFGMAVMARDWYLGNLQLSLGDISPSDESKQKVNANGYDLSSTDIGKEYDDRTALRSVASELLSGTYTSAAEYLDFDSSGDTLSVMQNYRYDCKNRGWVIDKLKVDAGNLEWKNYELLSLDIANSKDKISRGYSENEAELVAALYRLNTLQWDDSDSEFNLTNGDEGFAELERQLSLGVPVVTTIDDTHTINAIGLIQDSTCHRKYILSVYDNNYPDTTKEVYIEKKPKCTLSIDSDGNATVDKVTFEYSATYEGKQVGISFSEVEEH